MAAPSAQAFTIDVSESPGSNLSLTLRAIRSAKHSVLMNAYELTSPQIAEVLVEKVSQGVRVEILQEGQPVGGLKPESVELMQAIQSAMESNNKADHRYWIMTGEGATNGRRFRYDHAKYIVVDEKHVLMGSENYSRGGNPPVGTKGNRGWQVFLRNPQVAAELTRVFRNDSDTSHGDVVQKIGLLKQTLPLVFSGVPEWINGMRNYLAFDGSTLRALSDQPITLDADSVERFSSPETSMPGLLRFIGGARESLDLQLMSFNPQWGRDKETSPLAQAIVEAARKGVSVRLLLNDSRVFGSKSDQHDRLIDFFDNIAKKEGLKIEAYIADLKAMGVNYIHNKGALADGTKVLISSINWNQNSIENNREMAATLTGKAIYNHYQAVFESDWQKTRDASIPAK